MSILFASLLMKCFFSGAHHLEWVQSHGHNVHNEEHIYRKFAACVNRFLDGKRFNASGTECLNSNGF
jgi:hypothetical protein